MSKNPPTVDIADVVEVKPEVRALADKLKKSLELDKKTGTYDKDKHHNVFVENLPDGAPTVEQIKKLQHYTTVFAGAASLAVGETSIAVMKKHSTLERTVAEFPMVGKDQMKVVFDRSAEVTNRVADGKGGTVIDGRKTAYGRLNVSIDSYAAGSRGELKKIKSMLAVEAAKAFSE